MFTGIVEGVGKVVSFEEKKAAWLLKLQAPEFIAETLSDGDSLVQWLLPYAYWARRKRVVV